MNTPIAVIIVGTQVSFSAQVTFIPHLMNGSFIHILSGSCEQELRIISRRSVEGISLFTFLMGSLSSGATMYNGAIDNWPRFSCCRMLVC